MSTTSSSTSSWRSILPQVALPGDAPFSAAFIANGATSLEAAIDFTWQLPYARNDNPGDPFAPLLDGRGTCSTKHAMLARLFDEIGIPVDLILAIYPMNEANTPGVGRVLDERGLANLPEAHCFLRFQSVDIDITHPVPAGTEPVGPFLYTETITPGQVGDYKRGVHRAFLERWAQTPVANGYSLDELWSIREACIAALSG